MANMGQLLFGKRALNRVARPNVIREVAKGSTGASHN